MNNKNLIIFLIAIMAVLTASMLFVGLGFRGNNEPQLVKIPYDYSFNSNELSVDIVPSSGTGDPLYDDMEKIVESSSTQKEQDEDYAKGNGRNSAETTQQNQISNSNAADRKPEYKKYGDEEPQFYVKSLKDSVKKIDPAFLELSQELSKGRKKQGKQTILLSVNSMDNLESLEQLGFTIKNRFNFINTVELETGPDYLTEKLVQLGDLDFVSGVYGNDELHLNLKDALPIVGATNLWQLKDGLGNNITGKDITIAIFDTGLQYNHSAFGCTRAQIMSRTCAKIIDSWDFRNASNTYDVYDTNGHGTHVAGIAASAGGIDPGMKGTAPEAKLAIFKVCGDFGCNTNHIIEAVNHAIDPNKDNDTSDHYDIFSLSLGSTGMSPDHPLSLALDKAYETGVIVFASAGNEGLNGNSTVGCPACAKNTIAVGASTKMDNIWDESSRGYYSFANYTFAKPNIVAPGMDINSTYTNYNYKPQSGTSMSAPMVAGAAALLKQMHPTWTNNILRSALTTIADDLGKEWREQGTGRLNITKSTSIKAWFAPTAAEFGVFNDVMVHYYNRSIAINITSLNDSSIYYDISVVRYDSDSAYSVSVDKASITVGAFATETINITINCDYNLTTKDFHAGYIRINSSTETYKIPWIFKKEGDYLNHPPVANAGYNFFARNGTTVQLNASKSYDLDNDLLTYNWTIFLGSSGYVLDSQFSREPIYFVPVGDIETDPLYLGNYTVWKLVVSDGKATSTDYVDMRASMWDFYSEHNKLWYDNFSSEERIDYRDNEGYESGTVNYLVPATMPKLRQQFRSNEDATNIRICSKTTYMEISKDVLQNFTICKKDTGVNCVANTMSREFQVHGPPELIERCTPFFDYQLNKDDYYLTSIMFENLTDKVYLKFYIYKKQITDYWYTFTGSSISQEIPTTATPDASRRQLALGVYKGVGTDAGKIQLYKKGDLVHLDFPSKYTVTFQNITAGAKVNSTGYWKTDATTAVGDYVVRATIDNGAISESRDITIRITDFSSVPVVQPISDKTVTESQLLTVEVNATDIFSPLYYYINDTKFTQIGGVTGNKFTWIPPLGTAGNYSFMVNVSNGINQSTALFKVEVLGYVAPPNSPPSINSVSFANLWEGEKARIIVLGSDTDGDNLTYSINNTDFVKVGENVFEWQTADGNAGSYSVNLSVTDGIGTASQIVNLEIKNKYTLRLATAKYYDYYYNRNPQAWISTSTISVVSGGLQVKSANPAANFNVRSNEKITFTNSASGYNEDTDYIFLDNQLASCSAAICSYSTSGYSTSCTQRADPLYYDCYVTNPAELGTTMGFLWSTAMDTAWKINYLLTG